MRLFNARLGYTAEHVYENSLHRVGNLCGMKDVWSTRYVWKNMGAEITLFHGHKNNFNSFPFKMFTYLAV